MARVNPITLRRPDELTEEKTFTDPLQEGQEFPFRFRITPDQGTKSKAGALAESLTMLYLTGDYDWIRTKGESGKGPTPIILPGGPPVILTPQLIVVISNLMTYETGAWEAAGKTGDRPYTFEEWAALSDRAPNAFEAIVEWANTLGLQVDGKLKNSQRAITEAESASPSTAEGATTQPS